MDSCFSEVHYYKVNLSLAQDLNLDTNPISCHDKQTTLKILCAVEFESSSLKVQISLRIYTLLFVIHMI